MVFQIKGAAYRPESPAEKIRGISQLIPLQERSGYIFLLAYTKKETADSEQLLQLLSEHMHRLESSFGKDANAQHRFEQFLGALNETIAEQVREGRWHVPIEDFHAVVGIASQSQMYISGCGELTSLFLHRKPSQRYQIFNLFRSIQTEQSLPTWEKAFAVVLDGDLHPGDVFCVSDKDLQHTIPPEELNNILSTLPPVSSVEKVRQYYPHKDGLLLIVLKAHQSKSEAATSKEDTHRSTLSVAQLTETEDTTEQFLDDQRPNLAAFVGRTFSSIFNLFSGRKPSAESLKPATKKDYILRMLRIAGKLLFKYTKRSVKISAKHTKALTTKSGREKAVSWVKNIKTNSKKAVSRAKGKAGGIPRSTKFLIVGLILAVIVFAIGIRILSQSQARSAEEQSYQESIIQVEDLIERAAGAVIYKDEDQARSLYGNALTLVEDLPTDTMDRDEKAASLLSNIQSALDEIRHLVTIPNPPLLADLGSTTDGVFGTSLVKTSGGVLVFGTNGNVYELDQPNKRFVLAASGENIPTAIAAAEDDGDIYQLTKTLGEDEGVYSIDLESDLITPVLVGQHTWKDVVTYANRLYLLQPSSDETEGQIMRAGKTGSTFGEPTEWISQRTADFSEVVSMAIDGTIFVLSKDGVITRFESGSEVGWDTGVVDPPLTVATRIETDELSDFVYVLESETKRIVVFRKDTGEFIAQYKSNAFTDLSDIAIDEENYTIYLLAGSKLYSIAASHIE
jgi:hypothetical protein